MLPDVPEGQVLLHLLVGKVSEDVLGKGPGPEFTGRQGVFGTTPFQAGHGEPVPGMKMENV